MNQYEFDYLVFIGRFQPFHNGHKQVVQIALTKAQTVILLCGSADTPRTLRNPWFVDEREQMIRLSFNDADNARLVIQPLHDVPYNDARWTDNVQQTIHSVVAKNSAERANIGLIGHVKDNSSYYLNLFPQWDFVSVDNIKGINATDIRREFFQLKAEEAFNSQDLPESVWQWLTVFRQSFDYQELQAEQRYLADYKQQWASAPFDPIFVTTDAMVIQAEHILLVERKHRPGKGLWALPGGFLEADEWIVEGCLRELSEETNLAVSDAVLQQALVKQAVYDAPDRSARGRTITHVCYFELPTAGALADISAADDAANVFWQPLQSLDRRRFFEDHYDIIQDMLRHKK